MLTMLDTRLLFGILQHFTVSLVVHRGDNCVQSGFADSFI